MVELSIDDPLVVAISVCKVEAPREVKATVGRQCHKLQVLLPRLVRVQDAT